MADDGGRKKKRYSSPPSARTRASLRTRNPPARIHPVVKIAALSGWGSRKPRTIMIPTSQILFHKRGGSTTTPVSQRTRHRMLSSILERRRNKQAAAHLEQDEAVSRANLAKAAKAPDIKEDDVPAVLTEDSGRLRENSSDPGGEEVMEDMAELVRVTLD